MGQPVTQPPKLWFGQRFATRPTDGFVVVPPEHVNTFLGPLPVSRLWGVGAKGAKRLAALGISTVGQVAAP